MDTMLIHLTAILMLRTSSDLEKVRELGRTYASKYVGLVGALARAKEEALANAEPEEVATIERVFEAIYDGEQQATRAAAGLDSEPEA